MNSLITHFLRLLLIGNRIKYKIISINSFNTYLLSLISFTNIFHCRRMNIDSFNPIQDGLFWSCSRIGGGKKVPLPKICHTYPTIMILGTVVPYLKEDKRNIWMTWHTPAFCWNQHFSLEIGKFCYIKKYRYRLHFGT